jgi:thiol-disulfide isomerase/thioredoxin
MVPLPACLLAVAMAFNQNVVLLEFTADWCAPCRSMEPTVQRLREAGYPIRQVDVEQHPDLVKQFAVQPIPCFVLVRDGREVERVVGPASYDRLVQLFDSPAPSAPSAVPGGLAGPLPPTGPSPTTAPTDPAGLQSLPPLQPPRAAAVAPETSAEQLAQMARQRALDASVRITVVDSGGNSYATGTIIDTYGPEALVLTCGHIFRESNGSGEIRVEMFTPGAGPATAGRLVSYKAEERDIGLVSFRPRVPVTPVPVASTDYHPRLSERVFSVGCDHGANPTVRETTISAIDRYVGPPHIEIHGHPVLGRSGGGLFTADGRLIGLCNAADLQEDRGIYASLPTIQLELKKIGQERIYLQPASHPTHSMATTAPTQTGVVANPVIRTPGPTSHQPALEDVELICVVRSRQWSTEAQQVLVIENPSSDLLQLLGRESRRAGHPTRQPEGMIPSSDTVRRDPPHVITPPIVRAQGQ